MEATLQRQAFQLSGLSGYFYLDSSLSFQEYIQQVRKLLV